MRLVVPWKYGFKSIKAIEEIEFTKDPPTTFWQAVSPLEYDFWANVNPNQPYARWDQSMEHVLGEGRQIRTQAFNGYAGQVSNIKPNTNYIYKGKLKMLMTSMVGVDQSNVKNAVKINGTYLKYEPIFIFYKPKKT